VEWNEMAKMNKYSLFTCPQCSLYTDIYEKRCSYCGGKLTEEMKMRYLKKWRSRKQDYTEQEKEIFEGFLNFLNIGHGWNDAYTSLSFLERDWDMEKIHGTWNLKLKDKGRKKDDKKEKAEG
jgi:hypothetical protein